MDVLTFFTNLVGRIPIEKVLFPPRDEIKALEKFAANSSSPESGKTETLEQKRGDTTESPPKTPPELASPVEKLTSTTQEPEITTAVEAKGTACDICSLDHISACAGILEEANRFARR